MLKRTFITVTLTLGLVGLTSQNGFTQSKQRPAQKTTKTQPQLSPKASTKAVNKYRQVKRQLDKNETAAKKRVDIEKRQLSSATDLKNIATKAHDDAVAQALRTIPPVNQRRREDRDRTDHEMAMRNSDVRRAAGILRSATVNWANKRSSYQDASTIHSEARRQASAAKRTLTYAQRGDWNNAHRVVGRSNPLAPKTRAKKIRFDLKEKGPTPKGSGTRKGILKKTKSKI